MTGDFSLVNQSVPQDLTEERWRRLEALFHAARELPDGARSSFVERETAGDPDLRRQLQEMLAHAAAAPVLLARTVSTVARQAAGGADWLGRRIGPYKLVRELGRGGMGVVFEACRDDDEYRKTVALKVAPEWRDWQTLGERLRHERQILAGLEHPNIARFLDGGSQDGVPYFAMEFVEGSPISVFCSERRLGVRARIELFREVCGAIHYAHERLVVHRDLKPANILVTRDGVAKLLDFGIAKLLSPSPGDESATIGMRLWTPDYTSPEQVRAGAVTTRTDVYSLGLILYELLCGDKAQAADVASPLALDRAICETDPAPPSQRAAMRGDQALSRQLRGDLDTIVAKAIRKEPERRYGSAAALSEDLRRYLQGRPVEARPGSLAYRAWKLARRHRAAVAAGVLVVASVAGGVTAAVYQARRAERRFQQVRKLANSVLFGVDDRIKNLAGATEAREWAARNALEYLDNLAKDAGEDRSLLFELASAYQKVGDVQGYPLVPNLGHLDAAIQSHRKALAIAQRLAANDKETKVQRLLAHAYQRVAALLRAFHLTDQSIVEYKRGLAVADALYAAHPVNPEDSELLASILTTLGQAQAVAGNTAEASRSWARALDVTSRWTAQHPSDEAKSAEGRSRRMVVRGLLYTGDLDAAARLAQRHIRDSEALAARQPANGAFRRDLMNSYVEMAYVYSHPAFLSYGDQQNAAAFHQKALEVARQLAGNDPNNVMAQFDLAITEADLCVTLTETDAQQALGYCRQALAIADRWPTQFISDGPLAYLAEALHKLGRGPEAIEALRRSIEIRTQYAARDPSHFSTRGNLMRAHNQLGELLQGMPDRPGALAEYRQALAMAQSMASSNPANLVTRRDLADIYENLGHYYESEDRRQSRDWYQKSLDIWTAWPTVAPSTRMDRSRREKVEQDIARLAHPPR